VREYWYFYAVTFTLTTGTLSSYTFWYNTTTNSDFSQKVVIPWTVTTTFTPISLLPTDYVSIRWGSSHPPAIDATFSGVFATPYYLPNLNTYYFYFGDYESKKKNDLRFSKLK